MTAKAWYWIGLGMLVLSIGSTNMGRCWMGEASRLFDQVRTRTVPYAAMIEMATGHTQAGMGHMQSASARLEAQQARLQAAQARIEAQRARLEALAERQEFKHMNVLTNYSSMSDFDVETPGVSVTPDRVVVRSQGRVLVCPRVRVHVPRVNVPEPPAAVMQDPI